MDILDDPLGRALREYRERADRGVVCPALEALYTQGRKTSVVSPAQRRQKRGHKTRFK